jgi:hypothetical protein
MGNLGVSLSCLACFVGGLLAGVWGAHWRRQAKSPHACRLLRWHFGAAHVNTLVVTQRQFPARIRVDLQRSLDRLIQQQATVRYLSGIKSDEAILFGVSLSDLLTYETKAISVPLGHEEVDIGEAEPVRCYKNALWLLKAEHCKAAVLLSQVFHFNDAPQTRVDVAVENTPAGKEFAQSLFKTLEEAVRKAEAYRGKVLSLEEGEGYTGESVGITVHRLPTVQRDDLVLPTTTLDLLERNVLQFAAQRRRLIELGQSAKKGLLFYGPPGNGKTYTIRYLISELPGHTTLLIAAEQANRLGEYMNLARLLQPSLVVFEDVDLIARERAQAGSVCQETLLHKLLNELDGLKEDSEIVLVLTTNRPDVIEDALASRPGRVDQVVEFPVPDEDGRRKLIELYARAIQIPAHVTQEIVQKTEGVSAAFIKELMRRSLQFHLAEADGPMLTATDVRRALDEMLVIGGRLNQRTLGFGSGAGPRRPAACDNC